MRERPSLGEANFVTRVFITLETKTVKGMGLSTSEVTSQGEETDVLRKIASFRSRKGPILSLAKYNASTTDQ